MGSRWRAGLYRSQLQLCQQGGQPRLADDLLTRWAAGGDPLTRHASDPLTRRLGDPLTRRAGDPMTRRADDLLA